MFGEVDADTRGSGHATFSCNEAAPLKHLHHLVDTRCEDIEVSLDIRLRGCSAEAIDVLGDKGEVFELAFGGAVPGGLCWRRGYTHYTRNEAI